MKFHLTLQLAYLFSLSGSDNDGNTITNETSESWFAHEHVEYSFIENGTPNLPLFVNVPDIVPFANRNIDFGLSFGDSMTNLGDVDGDGISDLQSEPQEMVISLNCFMKVITVHQKHLRL